MSLRDILAVAFWRTRTVQTHSRIVTPRPNCPDQYRKHSIRFLPTRLLHAQCRPAAPVESKQAPPTSPGGPVRPLGVPLAVRENRVERRIERVVHGIRTLVKPIG